MTSPILTGLNRGTGLDPFLFFGDHDPYPNAFSVINLRPGPVWVQSQQLASTSPAGNFVGLQIDRGQIQLGTFIVSTPSSVINVLSSVVRVTLFPTLNTTPPAGELLMDVKMPDTVVFEFKPTGGTLVGAGDASFTVFSTTAVQLQYTTPVPADFDPVFNRINFPFVAHVSKLNFTDSATRLVKFTATDVPILRIVWNLPGKAGTAATLGNVIGDGSLAVYLDTGLEATVEAYGDGSIQIECGPSLLFLTPINTLEFAALQPRSRPSRYSIKLSKDSTVQTGEPISGKGFRFQSLDGKEIWTMFSSLTACVDQPRTVNNARIKIAGPGAMALTQNTKSGPITALIEATVDPAAAPASGKTYQSYALKNLLLKAQAPSKFVVYGEMAADGSVQTGNLTLTSNLTYVLPFLPDPYATNFQFLPGAAEEGGQLGPFDIKTAWQPDTDITIDVTLPPATLRGIGLIPPTSTTPANGPEDLALLSQMSSFFNSEVGVTVQGPTLLDLSSNISQFGVTFATRLAEQQASSTPPTVSHLYLQTPANQQHVITLPAVEWEPVYMATDGTADPADPIPNPYTFPDNGFPSMFATNAVTLRPVAPQEALNGLIESFHASSPTEVMAVFTLPFGIVSVAKIAKPKFNPPFVRPASFSQVQPTFKGATASLVGGNQLSMRPGSSRGVGFAIPSPSFPGSSIMLKYVPPSATLQTPVSVLGYKARDYNNDFGPAAASGPGFHGPLVPTTRVDISGYGESVFSDWNDPTVPAPGTSKVDLEVLIGRTEKEVVQQVYEVVHIGARFVRTVTMKRLNSGIVVRSSVLKPVTNGLYAFQNSKIITHPGLVKGYTAIRNLRDLPGEPITIDGTKFAPVKYDANVSIETGGSNMIVVPALDHRGYMVVDEDPNNRFGPSQYAKLLQGYRDNIGGPIDCIVKLSNLTVKLTGIGVDASTPDAGGDPQFGICARGMVEFAGHGEWSFLQMKPGLTPQYVGNAGVPIVRVGPSTGVSAATDPYRFADPADLLTSYPSMDYCLMHTTGSQRTMFPRPKIEDDGQNQITSVVAPLIADPYALSIASGPFPNPSICIPFETDTTTGLPKYNLQINDNAGHLKLVLGNNPFTPSITKRALVDGQTVGIIAYTDGSTVGPSTVSLTIDSANTALPWSFTLANVALASETGEGSGGRQEFIRTTGTFVCVPSAPPKLTDTDVRLGPPLDPVVKVVAFLQNFGPMPPMDVSMTNDWSLYVGFRCDLQRWLNRLLPGVSDFIKQYVQSLDLGIESNTRALTQTTTTQVRIILKFPTPWPNIKVMATAVFKLIQATRWGDGVLPPSGSPTLEFGLGAGIGITFGIWKFDAIGYFLVTQSVIWHAGTSSWGLGTSFLARVHVNIFDIVRVDVTIETKVEMLFIPCHRGGMPAKETIWGVAQFTVGVDVDLFLFIDIQFEVKGEWNTRFNDGPCELTEF